MKGEVQKFNNLSKSNTLTIFYKQVPMAQFIALSKKIKKADQIELANMYNEKCLSLYQEIENYKLEIENYKLIMVGLQESMRKNDNDNIEKEQYKKESEEKKKELEEKKKEIENIKKELEDVKKKSDDLKNENEENKKKLNILQEKKTYSISEKEIDFFCKGIDKKIEIKEEKKENEKYIKDKDIEKIKNEFDKLKNDKEKEIEKIKNEKEKEKEKIKKNKRKEIEKERKEKEKERKEKEKKEMENEKEIYRKKTENLEIEREKEKQSNTNLINEIREELSSLRKDYDLLNKSNKESEISFLNEIQTKDKKIEELNKEITNLKSIQKNIEKNLPKTDKELNEKLHQIIIENLFLMYLLNNSANYGKAIKELNSKFDYYSTLFLKENLKIKNLFTSILDEFIHRIHKKANFENLALDIYNYNCINKSEDYNKLCTESPFYTSGFVNDDLLLELNKKIYTYRTEIVNQIEELIQKCQNLINTSPELITLKKYDNSCLYSLNNGHLRINLNKLDDLKSLFLLTYIKYNDDEINSIEFFGEVAYDKQNKCDFINEQCYQLITSYKEDIKKIYLNDIKKILPSFVFAINLLFENLDNLNEIKIINCNLDDNTFSSFKFKTEIQYEQLDFTNNKLTKLSLFKEIKSKKIILTKNKIAIKENDKDINFIYLCLSDNPISIKDFNLYMKEGNIILLNLSDIRIKDVNEAKLLGETLASMKKLKVLYLNNCQMNEIIFKNIISYIKELNISFNFNKFIFQFIKYIKKLNIQKYKKFNEKYIYYLRY